MKGKKYSIEKIIQILSEAKMTSVTAVCRKYNICTSTYYRWQDNYSGLSSNQAKEMAVLKEENESLRKLVVEKELKNQALREFIKKKRVLRDAVTFLKEFGLPARIICEGFSISRAKLYRLLASSKIDPLSSTMAAIAYKHPEYGYRRIHVLLKREGIKVNHKKVYRIYSQLSLQKPVKASRKLKCSKPIHLATPEYPAHVWSADFLELYLRGRKLRILIVIDDFSRLVVGTLVDFSIPASRVLLVIEKSIALYSRPRIFRTDNGSEFKEWRLNRFLSNARIRHEFIEKGKPQQNGFSESFNARFEDECLRMLDLNLMPLKEIKQAIYDWIKEYNCQRPHSSIAYETPIRFHILSY